MKFSRGLLQQSNTPWLQIFRAAEFSKGSKNICKLIYTTNAIDSLNSSYRRLNRLRSVFPGDQALLKVLYLASLEATRKWTMPIRNWGAIYGEFCIMFEGRLPE